MNDPWTCHNLDGSVVRYDPNYFEKRRTFKRVGWAIVFSIAVTLLTLLFAATHSRPANAQSPSSSSQPKLQEQFGVQQYFHLRTSSTGAATFSGKMQGWTVMVHGGTVGFTIAHSTGVGSGYQVNTSSTIFVADGDSLSDKNAGIVMNPVFTITSIAAATTVYLDVSYLQPRIPGGPF